MNPLPPKSRLWPRCNRLSRTDTLRRARGIRLSFTDSQPWRQCQSPARALAPDTIDALGFRPDRQQVRFAKSAYLLAELPLGEFYEQQYGAPLVNFSARSLNDRLENDIGNPLLTGKRLEEIEDANRLTVVSGPSPMQSPNEASYNVFEASLAYHPLRRANALARQGSVHRTAVRCGTRTLSIRDPIESGFQRSRLASQFTSSLGCRDISGRD